MSRFKLHLGVHGFRDAGRLAGIWTTYAGLLFGATWALDRWLIWQLQREVAPLVTEDSMLLQLARREEAPGPVTFTENGVTRTSAGCSVTDCPNLPVDVIHGWDVCATHKPKRGDTITDARAVKVS